MRKIAEDQDGLFEYYTDGKNVFYIGQFTGRKNGLFGDMHYWRGYCSRRPVIHGPWMFLDVFTGSPQT